MGQDAGTPPGLIERIRIIASEEVAKFARSGFLRNASISEGGLTIKGGFLRLLGAANDRNLFYIGPITPALPDGTPQQGWVVRRADGTIVLLMQDAFPGVDGTLNQALTWKDRAANVVFADDTDSGQGIARPYMPLPFYLARNVDWPTTTATSFETIYRAKVQKHNPRLTVRVWGVSTVAGGVGEIRVMLNGTTQHGVTATTSNASVAEYTFGPLPVSLTHMGSLTVEVQARLASGTGGVQCCVSQGNGLQS